MNKNVFEALAKLDERLNDSVVPQIEAIGNLIGQITVDVAEEFEIGLDDLDGFKAGAEIIFADAFKKIKQSQK